jgi:hypothetical protein
MTPSTRTRRKVEMLPGCPCTTATHRSFAATVAGEPSPAPPFFPSPLSAARVPACPREDDGPVPIGPDGGGAWAMRPRRPMQMGPASGPLSPLSFYFLFHLSAWNRPGPAHYFKSAQPSFFPPISVI